MKIATHNGNFHGDDVFAIATLKLAGVCDEVVRTRDPQKLAAADMRVDVGTEYNPKTGDFDHHQSRGAGQRKNGIAYASFGLVWKQYGEGLAGSKVAAQKVDEKLVQIVDAHDNGQNIYVSQLPGMTINTIDRSIALFNPTWDSPATDNDYLLAFMEAVEVASRLLDREIAVAKSFEKALASVRQAITEATDPRLIVLDQFMSWRETVVNEAPDAKFVIYPRLEGTWAVQAIPKKLGVFENRHDLPVVWAGKRDQELAATTGVPDAVFCHTGRFLAVAKSKSGVLALAHLAIK